MNNRPNQFFFFEAQLRVQQRLKDGMESKLSQLTEQRSQFYIPEPLSLADLIGFDNEECVNEDQKKGEALLKSGR